MTTIRNLAMQYWNKLESKDKADLVYITYREQFKDRHYNSLTGSEIENIFYQEVIVEWFQGFNIDERRKLSHKYFPYFNNGFGITAPLPKYIGHIKEIYLKEHTKEEQVNEYPVGTVVRDMYNLAEDEFDKPTYTKLKSGKWKNGNIWDFTINSESIGDNKRFKVVFIPEQPANLYCVSSNALVYGKPCEKWCGSEHCLKNEQPKEEVDVWDEMINKLNDLTFKNITSENPLLKEDYSKWISEQMKQHYTLIKKQ